jgi:DNA polymerase III epsilon subunit-like protein
MSFSLLQPLRDVPFAFVDVETTGASADFGHRVIEIGIARVEGGKSSPNTNNCSIPSAASAPG